MSSTPPHPNSTSTATNAGSTTVKRNQSVPRLQEHQAFAMTSNTSSSGGSAGSSTSMPSGVPTGPFSAGTMGTSSSSNLYASHSGTGGPSSSSGVSVASSSTPGSSLNSYNERSDLPMGGYSMQNGDGPTKGEYKLVGIADEDHAKGIASTKGLPGAGLMTVPETQQHPTFAIASYCIASISMTVINKFVLSGRHFTMNFLLLAIQSIVCVACVVTGKRSRIITYRDFDKEDARKWFPVSFLLVMVIYTGSKALQFLSIPVYTIFKNLTIILIAYGEVLWFGGSVSGMTLVAFGLMVLSSLIAAWDDVSRVISNTAVTAAVSVDASTTMAGYIWMMVNCLVSAGYVLGMRKRIKVTNFSDWDSMFYNNLLSIPVLVVFSAIFEDWSQRSLQLNFPEEGRDFLLFAMFISGAVAVGISYSTAWCVRVTSSTTYSMVGSLNKLPVAASGLIFFGDPVTFGSVSAITVGFIAGLVYTVAKQAQAAAKKMGSNNLEMGNKPR